MPDLRPSRLLPLVALLAVLVAPCPTRAAGPDDGAPSGRVVVAGAACDTLPYGPEDVLPVAISELGHNEWVIQRQEALSGAGEPGHRLVTRWKPLKHILARAFFSDLRARCVVDILPLAGGTQVTIQGGLTAAEDLESNPGFPLAQATYRRAAEKWLAGVRAELAHREQQGLLTHR